MKKINIYTIFTEPSSYTVDLIHNIHEKLNIDYCFIEDSSEAKTDLKKDSIFLSNKSLFSKIVFLFKIVKNNHLIIMNGYNRIEFIILFLINLFFIKKRFIAIESDTQYKKETETFKFKIKRTYLSYIFKKRYILGFSGGNFTHKDLFRNYSMEEKRIFLAPMMIDNKKFFNPNKKTQNDKLTFLFVGRVIPLKNLNHLMSSFIKVFENKKDVVLNIVGSGSELESLKENFDKYENIIFKGAKYSDELVQEYFNSDVLILPSLKEAWGLVINEAMSAGLVIISSNKVGANEDLIKDKKTGFVFDVDKKDDLSQKMLYLYNNRNIVTEYSENAKELMKNYWNYDLYEKNLNEAMEYVKNETVN